MEFSVVVLVGLGVWEVVSKVSGIRADKSSVAGVGTQVCVALRPMFLNFLGEYIYCLRVSIHDGSGLLHEQESCTTSGISVGFGEEVKAVARIPEPAISRN